MLDSYHFSSKASLQFNLYCLIGSSIEYASKFGNISNLFLFVISCITSEANMLIWAWDEPGDEDCEERRRDQIRLNWLLVLAWLLKQTREDCNNKHLILQPHEYHKDRVGKFYCVLREQPTRKRRQQPSQRGGD